MQLTLVTGNPRKAEEIKGWLDLPAVELIQKDLNPPEIQDLDLEIVAKQKAVHVFERYKEPFILDDTGIFFEAYNQFPGYFTKHAYQTLGYKGIFKLTEDNNRAYFKTILAYMDATLPEPMLFTGISKGIIAPRDIENDTAPHMPYDSIFIPDGSDHYYSDLSLEELKTLHNRARAVAEFRHFFSDYAQGFE